MSRELFVYWHAAPEQAAAAQAVVGTWQRRLAASNPGLVTRLYRRSDERGERVTLMETYARAGGIDDALQATLVAEGNRETAPWRQGARHVEVFEPLA